jgi:hypothetical protein
VILKLRGQHGVGTKIEVETEAVLDTIQPVF